MSYLERPKAVVLSCMGGSQGDLGVVRSLGMRGVHVVLFAEYDEPIAKYSRYVKEFYRVPGFAQQSSATMDMLIAYAKQQPCKPVIFPTADPDLKLVSEWRDELAPYYALFVSDREIIEGFMDKAKFFEYSKQYAFPNPHTWMPRDYDDLTAMSREMAFPVIIKPIFPHSWMNVHIQKLVDHKKAVRIDEHQHLLDLYRAIAQYNSEMVVQEYIPGRDDHLYSLHIYMDRDKHVAGVFTGQKLRTYPTYAGIGCFVQSVYVPEIVEAGRQMLQRVGYTGLALMQFKKDPRDGSFKLIEVNPRVSSWNGLATACGVNLPYLAYLDASGEGLPAPGRQVEGIKYVYFEHDLPAFLDYRRHGELSLFAWLLSYRGKKVFQYFMLRDSGPFWVSTWGLLKRGIRKALRLIGLARR